MDGIKIDVTGNIAKVTEKPRRITSGTIGLPVEFTFDDQWDGLSKKAVFRTGHFSIVCDLNEEENTVPWEVLVFPNMWLSIGVYGVNEGGTVSIPTIWVNVSVIQPGTVPDGASPAEPTPPVWQRIEDEVNRIGGVVDDVNDQYNVTKEQVEKLGESIENTVENQQKIEDRVSNLEENGTGSVAPLIVTLDQSTGKASHNSTAIFSIYNSGTSVQLSAFGGYAPISHLTPDESAFMLFDGAEQVSIKIYKDGDYVVWTHEFATVDDIGDISSALDELHTYAQGLIAGGVSE